MMKRICVAVLGCSLSVSCGGGGNSDSSPTSPSGSGGGAPAAGAWTGTFARPGGAAPLSLRWEAATTSDENLAGPMTVTNGGNTFTVRVSSVIDGNDNRGYGIHFSFQSGSGDNPAFPNCTIFGSPPTNQGAPFPRPHNRIDVAQFEIKFNSCPTFVEYPPGVQGQLLERGQLTLTK